MAQAAGGAAEGARRLTLGWEGSPPRELLAERAVRDKGKQGGGVGGAAVAR